MPTFGQQGPAFKERMKLKQYGPNTSRFGMQYPPHRGTSRHPEFLLGPDDLGFMDARKKIPGPRKGYQSLAHRKPRWIKTGFRRRAPTSVGPQLLLYELVKAMPKRSPFGVTGERFPDAGEGAKESADVIPDPGFYDVTKVKIGRRIEAQHKLGHGASIPLPFHVHCSHRRNERCHTCKSEVWCLPSYYTVPGRHLYLCPLCYFVERQMALTLKATTVAKFKRVMDCASIHTHFPYSDKVLTHASTQEIKWLARKELYMHLHFPKRRDETAHAGVRHFAAP
ncbi:hypothetical protein RvY_00242 [Ramazzottius varieornatus]|uniref:Uncharacterized protein n=1 Tax=Ramazzottius varieornatus TaxID=947166 RepID=A0A1D1UMJ7_RAMVA|nr:hypothetical protein RvY_00242 [Ramazzottius varieornatus]